MEEIYLSILKIIMISVIYTFAVTFILNFIPTNFYFIYGYSTGIGFVVFYAIKYLTIKIDCE